MKNGQPADNTLHARYEKYEQILKNLTIMSDMFMRNVFKSNPPMQAYVASNLQRCKHRGI